MTSVPDRHGVLRDALSQLHFDDLVDELQSRLQAVLRTHNRVDRLLQAVHAVASDLEREQVLHRIVDAAMNLVDAVRRIGGARCRRRIIAVRGDRDR